MHLELENLINMALADGEVTEKERAIILRKAEILGEDKDEIEMILDGKLALLKKEKEANVLPNTFPAPPLETKSNKEGDLKKCPSCGAPVQSFNTKCPECGHEFRNIESSQSVQKLFEMLNNLENTRKEDGSDPLKALGGSFSKMLSGQNMYGDGKLGNQKKELIRNFPIPNSKEDILEFLALAVSRAKKIGNAFSMFSNSGFGVIAHNDMVPVWKAKCEQIILKARFAMKEDKKTLEEIEIYAKQLGIK